LESNKTATKSSSLIFKPYGQKDLRTYHPELKSYDEFKDLHSNELLFVWNYSILYKDEKPELKRREMAFHSSFGSDPTKVQSDNYIDSILPIHIQAAIEKMQSFDMSARLAARYIIEKTYVSYLKILSLNESEFAFAEIDEKTGKPTGGTDWQKVSQYVNSTVKINEALTDLVKKLEEGYGFGATKVSISGNINEDVIDKWYKRKNK